MFRREIGGIITIVALLSVVIVSTAFAATIDSTLRTVTTPQLDVAWDPSNPEEIVDLRWNGSPDLTATAAISGCPGDLEYFGNSWVSQDEGTPSFVFVSLVGWGTSGTWAAKGGSQVKVNSASTGCYGSAGIPVESTYKFFDHGPAANRFRVARKFDFRAMPLNYDFRPYIPRLSPMNEYTQVWHPDATGSSFLVEDSTVCDFGCRVDDWNGEWFAIHNPSNGKGLIVKRAASPYGAALWVDQDSASYTNASSVLLLKPVGGFTGKVNEVENFCFYDSTLWTPSLSLPSGC
ncbi:MAG: hypothetical protein AB1894_24670 [Chloroflexota bacterium]